MAVKIFNFEIRKINKKKKNIIEITKPEKKLIENCLQYSMTNVERMWSLIQSFHHVRQESLTGDFVECGVYKGGNALIAAKIFDLYKTNNEVAIATIV